MDVWMDGWVGAWMLGHAGLIDTLAQSVLRPPLLHV